MYPPEKSYITSCALDDNSIDTCVCLMSYFNTYGFIIYIIIMILKKHFLPA